MHLHRNTDRLYCFFTFSSNFFKAHHIFTLILHVKAFRPFPLIVIRVKLNIFLQGFHINFCGRFILSQTGFKFFCQRNKVHIGTSKRSLVCSNVRPYFSLTAKTFCRNLSGYVMGIYQDTNPDQNTSDFSTGEKKPAGMLLPSRFFNLSA